MHKSQPTDKFNHNPIIPVIILNWNGIEDTIECMEALLGQTYKPIHIYIVDNASKGDDANIIREKWGHLDNVTLVFNDKNLGFTLAHNEIFRDYILPNKAYKYVALLNNDTSANPDWLKQLFLTAERESATIVASKMINYFDRKKMDNAGHRMINTAEIVSIGHNEPIELYDKPFVNMGACAGATLYAVDMLRDIGIFDEYFLTGYEDAELGVRANILGYKSIYEPKAIVFHKVSASIRKIVDYNYLLKIQTSVYYSYLKLMPVGVLLINLPSFLFKYLAILIIDIVFLRIMFLKILFHAAYNVFVKERKFIWQQRRAFLGNHKPISSWKIIRKQEFFLWFDFKRFVNDVLLKKKPLLQKAIDEKKAQ